MRKSNKELKEKYLGKEVEFISGNFSGLTGVCKSIDFESKHSSAIYGIRMEFDLSSGQKGYAHKSEHFQLKAK